jgi:hypothetical protein
MSRSIFAAVLLCLTCFSSVSAQDFGRIRDALSGALGGTLCSGPAAGWCAALGIEAAYWIDKGTSFAIDRHFENKDQEFANKHKVTICYKDGKCIRPK